MKFEVPADVRSAIAECEQALARRHQAERAAEDARLRRQMLLDKERHARYDELYRYAEEIIGWCRAYAASPEGRAIGALIGKTRLRLYVSSRYWLGEPATDRSVTTSDALSFDPHEDAGGHPVLWNESRHKGMVSASIKMESVADLIFRLHPDFLRDAHSHLSGSGAWNHILRELELRGPRKGR